MRERERERGSKYDLIETADISYGHNKYCHMQYVL